LVVCFINFSDFENVSSNDIGPLLKLNALSIPLSFKSFSSTSTDPPIKITGTLYFLAHFAMPIGALP